MKFSIRKIIYVLLAFLFLAIGAIGVVLPVLPTTPFLLAASFFFAKGSERFNKWFLSTKLYKNHLESFVKSRAMTFKTKVSILSFASSMLLIAIYLVNNIYVRITIVCIMIYKYYYFIFNIKTIKKNTKREEKNSENIDEKRAKERKIVTKMIEIYCRGNRHGSDTFCSKCKKLISYVNIKIDRCPFIEVKTFCSNCKVHCYNAEMREKIKKVMRYSGPRMLLYNPVMVIRHVIDSKWDRYKKLNFIKER